MVIKYFDLRDHRSLVADIAINHEFGGDRMADSSGATGQLRIDHACNRVQCMRLFCTYSCIVRSVFLPRTDDYYPGQTRLLPMTCAKHADKG